MRVAAIDIGTNSTRLLVADVAGARVDEVARRLTITRLGEGVDEEPVLREAAMRRVLDVLAAYTVDARGLGAARVLATATSAVRDATNGRAFLEEIERRFGIETRLLSGEEEAETTFAGVTSGQPLADETLIVDIGGGSTELIVGAGGGVRSVESLQVGCVRLTERFLRADPPAEAELEACTSHVIALLPALEPAAMVGVAGTATTLAALDLDLAIYEPDRVHGHALTRAAVERHYHLLRTVTLPERKRILHLEPKRAPVIVAGTVILRAIMDAYRIGELRVSERDILHGIALAATSASARPVAVADTGRHGLSFLKH